MFSTHVTRIIKYKLLTFHSNKRLHYNIYTYTFKLMNITKHHVYSYEYKLTNIIKRAWKKCQLTYFNNVRLKNKNIIYI